MRKSILTLAAGFGTLTILVGLAGGTGQTPDNRVPLEFSGGHEIGDRDFGRPVVLIAHSLGVQPDDFRKAFSGVTPARGGRPSKDEVHRNKAALMKVLEPLGVSNERLDEVSNYYRFRPRNGELWKNIPARGYAVVENGVVTDIVITESGSGYCSPPQVTFKGAADIVLQASLSFSRDLKTNGAIESVKVAEKSDTKKSSSRCAE